MRLRILDLPQRLAAWRYSVCWNRLPAPVEPFFERRGRNSQTQCAVMACSLPTFRGFSRRRRGSPGTTWRNVTARHSDGAARPSGAMIGLPDRVHHATSCRGYSATFLMSGGRDGALFPLYRRALGSRGRCDSVSPRPSHPTLAGDGAAPVDPVRFRGHESAQVTQAVAPVRWAARRGRNVLVGAGECSSTKRL